MDVRYGNHPLHSTLHGILCYIVAFKWVYQMEAWLLNKHRLENAFQSLISSEETGISEGINVADFGCGLGPVPSALIELLVDVIQRRCTELNRVTVPKLVMYMNDLPSNDFSLLFKNLLDLEVFKARDNNGAPPCFLMGVPGSYYDILFPHNNLHFVHANYTVHWLSKVPPGIYDKQGMSINKGNINISESSPKEVAEAYLTQFEQDFTQFIKCRSEEVVHNGCMLMTLRGRPCATDSTSWTSFEFKIFTKALASLVSEGLIKEETLDNFNIPSYYASVDQLESIVKKEGSFAVEDSETMMIDMAPGIEDKWDRAQAITNIIRVFSESLVLAHFGEGVVSPLYDKLVEHAFQFLDNGIPPQNHAVTILLRKKQA